MMHQENSTFGQDVDISEYVSYNHVHTGDRGKIRHFSILFGSSESPIRIGSDFFIGTHCYLNGIAGITIGDRVTMAHGVRLFSDSGPNTSPWLQQHYPLTSAPIHIGSDVWIGAGAMILPGVRIGNRCVVGAGSLVKENMPDNTVAAGSPAKIIRHL
jgi:maltose O-acetyltransferase